MKKAKNFHGAPLHDTSTAAGPEGAIDGIHPPQKQSPTFQGITGE